MLTYPSGLFTYTGLNLMIGLVMWISRGSLVPKDYEQKEYWTWKPAGDKPILLRLFSRHRRWGDSQDGNSIVNDVKDGHLSIDAKSAAATSLRAGPSAGTAAGAGTAAHRPLSVESRSLASRAGSTAGDRIEIRRPPTPGPFRTMY